MGEGYGEKGRERRKKEGGKTMLEKRRCWNKPWKMFNICAGCHFFCVLWLRGSRKGGMGG